MKILITGATARHVGRLDPLSSGEDGKLYYHACPHIFAKVARDLGHQVDIRPVDPTENLTKYHRVCVFLGPLVDPQMTFVHGALAALAERPDAFVFLDDWKVGTIGSSFRRMAGRDYFYLWHSPFAKARPLRARAISDPKARKKIERIVVEMSSQPWDRHVVVPLHAWGDPTVIPGCPISRTRSWLDYTPELTYPKELEELALQYVNTGKKKRAWLLATLGTRERWVDRQEPKWPVHRFGYKAERISQRQVMLESASRWGSLAPRYPHARASWWRPRFIYSPLAYAVVACDESEGISQAAPGIYGLRARYIESFNSSQLRALAYEQACFVARRSWKTDDLREAVRRLMR